MKFNEQKPHEKNLTFYRLTNRELFDCAHVCPEWINLQEAEFATRHTLVLLIGPGALDAWTDSCFNEFRYHAQLAAPSAAVQMDTVPDSPQKLAKRFGLKVRSFTGEFARYLVSKFTNLKQLIIASNQGEPGWTEHLQLMCTEWSRTLRTVKIFMQSEGDYAPRRIDVNAILVPLNTLPKLAHLTLDFSKIVFAPSEDTNLQMPALTKLNLACRTMTQQLADSFSRYVATKERLTQIGLCVLMGRAEDELVWRYFELEGTITAKFSHLLHQIEYLPQYIPTVSRNFRNLTHFCVNLVLMEGVASYFRTLTQLASLTSLTNLNMNLLWHGTNYLSKEYEQIEVADELYLLPRLPSVQVLKLEMVSREHSTLADAQLGHIFPNVHYIELSLIEFVCHCTAGMEQQSHAIQILRLHRCLSKTLSGLKPCQHLYRCKFLFRDYHWPIVINRLAREIVDADEELRFKLV